MGQIYMIYIKNIHFYYFVTGLLTLPDLVVVVDVLIRSPAGVLKVVGDLEEGALETDLAALADIAGLAETDRLASGMNRGLVSLPKRVVCGRSFITSTEEAELAGDGEAT